MVAPPDSYRGGIHVRLRGACRKAYEFVPIAIGTRLGYKKEKHSEEREREDFVSPFSLFPRSVSVLLNIL